MNYRGENKFLYSLAFTEIIILVVSIISFAFILLSSFNFVSANTIDFPKLTLSREFDGRTSQPIPIATNKINLLIPKGETPPGGGTITQLNPEYTKSNLLKIGPASTRAFTYHLYTGINHAIVIVGLIQLIGNMAGADPEQIMYQPMQRTLSTEERNYNSADLEYLSASVLYTPKIEPLANGGITIPYGNLGIPGLKDLHDTYRVDRYGNLYDGHTTFDNKFHINTDPLKSRRDIFKK